MVRTTANGSYRWRDESAFGTPSASKNWFGYDASITTDLTNNAEPLTDIGENTVGSFAYNKLEGSISIDSVLSTPWLLNIALGRNMADNVDHTIGTKKYVRSIWKPSSIVRTMTIETLFDGETADIDYELKGCVMTNISLSSDVNSAYTNMSFSAMSGRATADSTTYVKTARDYNAPDFPFTYRYGGIKYNGAAISEVESFSANIETGAGLQRDHGTELSTSAYEGLMKFTGSLKYSLKDKKSIDYVLLPESNNSSDIELQFKNQDTADDNYQEIKLTFHNVSFSRVQHRHSKLERVYNELDWEARDVTCTVINQYRSPITDSNTNTVANGPTLTASARTGRTVRLNIGTVAGATKYRIYYGLDENPTEVHSTVSQATNIDLAAFPLSEVGYEYYFRVVALKDGVVISRPSPSRKVTIAT